MKRLIIFIIVFLTIAFVKDYAKTDDSNSIYWIKTIGGVDEESAVSIKKTNDGGYIFNGSTKSYGAGDIDFFVVKLKQDLGIEWAKTIGREKDDIWFGCTAKPRMAVTY